MNFNQKKTQGNNTYLTWEYNTNNTKHKITIPILFYFSFCEAFQK